MKFKYIGELDEITLRGVAFKKNKAVDVDCTDFQAKLSNLDYFKEVKTRAKNKK